jgi:hypothetical protein
MHVPTDGNDYDVDLRGRERKYSLRGRLSPASRAGYVTLQLVDQRLVEIPVSAFLDVRRVVTPPSAVNQEPAPTSHSATERLYLDRIWGKGSTLSGHALVELSRCASLDEELPEDSRGVVARALDALAGQYLEEGYEPKERAHKIANEAIRDLKPLLLAADIDPPAFLRALADQLQAACEEDYRRFLDEAPIALEILDLNEGHRVVVDRRELLLTVAVQTATGTAPVEQVTLLVRPSRDVHTVGGLASVRTMRGGERRELSQRLKVSDLAVGLGEVQIDVSLRYRRANGAIEESPNKSLLLQLASRADFIAIKNPYTRYSGGNPVEDRRMFYGRRELLERMTDQLRDGRAGQCFVLYGQKRSGKSSVLRQLESRLAPPVFTVSLTLGAIDTAEADRSFIQLCVDEIHNRLVVDFKLVDLGRTWPTDRNVSQSPIESFRRVILATNHLLRQRSGYRKPKIVLLVDEFTYVYEYITEGLVSPAFMRQWKALLQTGTFSAVLVGQDSMPNFKRAYPNEFGVTQDERLTYLDIDEARALADEPLRHKGASRYKGGSLDRVIELTAGAPYYLQVVCDQLVRRMNRERTEVITESLVEKVRADLTLGPTALTIDKFDPLITAAGESVAHLPRSAYLAFLERLAALTQTGPAPVGDVVRSEDEGNVIRDLLAREVVCMSKDRRCSIRVSLFAEWLRANAFAHS